MFDIVGLGELLIDFTPAGFSSSGNPLFQQNSGGAPPNVLAAAAKLGGKGAFIGMVGYDQFGRYLKGILESNKINTEGLKFTHRADTTLAFVHLKEDGDRSFSFYRNPGADMMLREEDVPYHIIDASKIFHFGSLSMTDEPSKSATLKAVQYAKDKGKIISYDPNWRPPLWESDEKAKEGMLLGLEFADIIKVSEEELTFLTDEEDWVKGSKMLMDKGISLVVVTRGAKGCYFRCIAGAASLPTYDTKVVDTTGSGDAFMGTALHYISQMDGDIQDITLDAMLKIVDYANAAGALCATKKGGVPAMPTLSEIEDCMAHTPKLILE